MSRYGPIDKQMKFNGTIVFWSLTGGTNLSTLRERMEEVGLPDIVPEEIEDAPALRRALGSIYSGRRIHIEPMEGIRGMYSVVDVDASGILPEYTPFLRTGVIAGELEFRPEEFEDADRIHAAFQQEKENVPAAKLGQMLVRLSEKCRGVSLRPSGGFYWIPNEHAETWENAATAIRSANPACSLFRVRTTTDTSTVDAVCESVVLQVTKELEKMQEEIEDGVLGKRALGSREARAIQLDEMLDEYESILGKTLTSLREQADDVGATAALALLTVGAAK